MAVSVCGLSPFPPPGLGAEAPPGKRPCYSVSGIFTIKAIMHASHRKILDQVVEPAPQAGQPSWAQWGMCFPIKTIFGTHLALQENNGREAGLMVASDWTGYKTATVSTASDGPQCRVCLASLTAGRAAPTGFVVIRVKVQMPGHTGIMAPKAEGWDEILALSVPLAYSRWAITYFINLLWVLAHLE